MLIFELLKWGFIYCVLSNIFFLVTTKEQRQKLKDHFKKAWNEEP